MTEDRVAWSLVDYDRRALPPLPLRPRDLPATVAYVSIRLSGLAREIAADVVSGVVAILRGLDAGNAHVGRRGRKRAATPNAVDVFIGAIGGEDWWLGDLVIEFDDGPLASLIWPNADGELLEVIAWGEGVPLVLERIEEHLTSFGYDLVKGDA